MAFAGAIAAIAGSAFGFVGAMEQSAATKKAEKARKQQMRLDATRRRREVLRQAQVARATATSNATNQGAQFSSALAGAQAGISGAAGRETLAVNQNEMVGNKIFEANQAFASGGNLISFGSGISNLGGAFANALPVFSRQTNSVFV